MRVALRVCACTSAVICSRQLPTAKLLSLPPCRCPQRQTVAAARLARTHARADSKIGTDRAAIFFSPLRRFEFSSLALPCDPGCPRAKPQPLPLPLPLLLLLLLLPPLLRPPPRMLLLLRPSERRCARDAVVACGVSALSARRNSFQSPHSFFNFFSFHSHSFDLIPNLLSNLLNNANR